MCHNYLSGHTERQGAPAHIYSQPCPCPPLMMHASNARSVAVITGDRALLPLEVGQGWQHLQIDLERMVRLAFGSIYLTTSQVTLLASARIAKVFFQSEPFSDFEMPPHLRAVPE